LLFNVIFAKPDVLDTFLFLRPDWLGHIVFAEVRSAT